MMIKRDYLEVPLSISGKEVSRLNFLYFEDHILALEKPVGVLIDAYPWYEEVPSIIGALNKESNRPRLLDCQIDKAYSVYCLEPEVTGVALIATNKEAVTFLRNEFGSGKFTFRFTLLAKNNLNLNVIECDLPLAKHYNQNSMIVSNKTGKKSKTLFKLLSTSGKYQLWEAQSNYLRIHQIRVHAMERGIQIIGEKFYTQSDSPRSMAFKNKLTYKQNDIENTEKIEDLFLHLSSIEFEKTGQKIVIKSPLPSKILDLLG